MNLTRRTIRVITLSLMAALLGLIALQYILLHNAYELRQQAFERSVYAAMNSIAQKLEANEALGGVFRIAVNAPHTGRKFVALTMASDSIVHDGKGDSLTIVSVHSQLEDPMPLHVEKNTIHYRVGVPQRVVLRLFNLSANRDTVLVDRFMQAGEYVVPSGEQNLSNGEFVLKYQADSCVYTMHTVNGNFEGALENSTMMEKRKEIVGRIVDNLSVSEREPIERRIRPALLDSIIANTLHDAGISLPFVYGITSGAGDSLRMGKPGEFEKSLIASGFRARLFPTDFLFNEHQLLLYFPGQSIYLLKQVGPVLALTVLFMSVIVLCFVYTIRTIIKQKQFSLRLVDFVNNMTHEFKTPISTIAVAAETIVRPDVIDKVDKVTRYSAVIREENMRMKKQVDTILQLAVLEEGDYELKLEGVDVHELLRHAASHVALQIEPENGSIECRLGAARSFVRGDVMHLTNIVHNVLDNACKYSPGRPSVTVSTSNKNSSIAIDIADHGIGIRKEDIARVFEKYYRVHTGNLHDVKGFGLGLSYVKLMMEAHGGTVSLESEQGRGTTVHLLLPLSTEREG